MKLPVFPLSMRITIGAMLIVALAALILLLVTEVHFRQVYFVQRRAHLEEAFNVNEQRLILTVATLARAVQFLAATPPIAGIIRAERNNGFDPLDGNTRQQWEVRLSRIIGPFLLAHPEYCQVILIGGNPRSFREIVRISKEDGQVKAMPPAQLQSEVDRDLYAAILRLPAGRVHLAEIEMEQQTGQAGSAAMPMIQASLPIFAPDGQVFGLMTLCLRLQDPLQATAANLPPGVSIYIADRRGRYLLFPDGLRKVLAADSGGNEIQRDFPALAALFEPHSPVFLPLPAEAPRGGADYFITAGRVHYDPDQPEQFFVLAYRVSGAFTQLFTAIPQRHIVAGLAASLLVCAMVLFFLHRTFLPLKQLVVAAEAITAGRGAYQNCLPTASGGEIGSLTIALSAMLIELSRREQEIVRINQGLEEQVADRTRELTAVNARLVDEKSAREAVLRQHQAIIATAPDGFWLTGMNGIILEANEAYGQISGYSVAELVGMHVSQLEARELSRQEVTGHIAKLTADGYERFETRHRHKDGHEIEIEVSASYLSEAQRIFVFCRDITERKRIDRESRHRQELLYQAERLGKLGSWELDLVSGELLWSDEVYRIFELDPTRFTPSYENFLQVLHPDDRDAVSQAYQGSLRDRRPYDIEHRLLFANGRIKWVREHCATIFDGGGQPLRSVGMVQDISDKKRAEAEILALAFHDQLTGLANRRFFIERFRAALAASARHDNYGAVLFIDMDNFKTLNDTRGHEVGDLMLIEVADRLRIAIRIVDIACRLGGDEFVVLMIEELGPDRADAERRAGLVAERVRESLAAPYIINDYVHHSSPSIGVALYRGKDESVDLLLQQADHAMYQAKKGGRNQVCFYRPA